MIDRREFISGAAAAGAALAVRPARAAAGSKDVAGNVERYLQPIVQRNDYSGFVILERAGKTLMSRGFGFADDEARIPHSENTHYASASIGKLFTRAAILSLEKTGKLNRNDPIAKYIPAFPGGAGITVQHLVDHNSGIARDLPPQTDLKKVRSLEELVAIVAAMPIEAKAGETTAYSNNGYRLLARIIEIAGGGDYDSLVRETVFEPRGMRGTFPNMPSTRFPQRTVGHWPAPGWESKVAVAAIDMSNHRGAGSFAITPVDMLRFLKTLPLESKDLAEAERKDVEGKPKPRSLGHDGFGEGYANLAYAYPDENAFLVSLSNMQTGVFMPMHVEMRRLLFGERVDTPLLSREKSAATIENWSRYVGDYDLRPGAPLRIRRSGDILTVDAGEGGHPLIALGGDRFFMRLRYATMAFQGDPGRPASLLRWAEGGGEFPLKRIG